MTKPENYNETPVGGGYVPVRTGGHTAIIKKVAEKQNRNGGDMIVVLIDFDASDDQANYFMNAFQKDVRPDKKYPNDGKIYINVNNRDGKCSKQFKTFCDCFEKSNNTTVSWTAKDWCAQFKDKKIGAVYGEVEEIYNGDIHTRPRHRWFCNYDVARQAEVPKLYEVSDDDRERLERDNAQAAAMNTPTGTSDELPFA